MASYRGLTETSNQGGGRSDEDEHEEEHEEEHEDEHGEEHEDEHGESLSYLNEGTENVINALGEFTGEWIYRDYGGSRSLAGESTTSPVPCQNGSAMTRFSRNIDYFLTWRNERGAFIFANRGTANSGIYVGCNDFTSDSGITYSFAEYYYLEGKGVGIYSCVDRAVWHGAFLNTQIHSG